VYKRLTYMYF